MDRDSAGEGEDGRFVRLLGESGESRRGDLGGELGRGGREESEEGIKSCTVVGRGGLARPEREVDLLGDGNEGGSLLRGDLS